MFAQATETLSGGAGWAGVGLLGLTLSWLFFGLLPAHAKQIKELLDAQATQLKEILVLGKDERDTDRQSRHNALDTYNQLTLKQHTNCLEEVKLAHAAEELRLTQILEGFERRNKDWLSVARHQTEVLETQTKQITAGLESVRETLLAELRSRKQPVPEREEPK